MQSFHPYCAAGGTPKRECTSTAAPVGPGCQGVDVFDPTTGEVRAYARVEDDVACCLIDTDHVGDRFFMRHAYFLGGKGPYEKLRGSLKADIDPDAWATLYRTESRPFPAPAGQRIAVKVINHYGDEAMRVFRVG
jgi:adenine-specific DNA-methyltransferase